LAFRETHAFLKFELPFRGELGGLYQATGFTLRPATEAQSSSGKDRNANQEMIRIA
jgi:hypothetical protein